MRFEASDGVELEGRLFGSGRTGVVLSHLGNPGDSQADRYGVAEVLDEHGYTVLTYDRRGVCPGGIDGCSSGNDTYSNAWKDVMGAVRFPEGGSTMCSSEGRASARWRRSTRPNSRGSRSPA